MPGFSEIVREVARRLPEASAVLIMGSDGIVVEKLLVDASGPGEAIAAELTTLLRSGGIESSDTGLGRLRDVTLVSDRVAVVVNAITPEYFLLAILGSAENSGKARFVLRVAALRLEREFA